MNSLALCKDYFVVAKGVHLDYYDNKEHKIINVPLESKPQEEDYITEVVLSPDSQYLALMTSSSKQLILYNVPNFESCERFALPRSASRIRFTPDNSYILAADKGGDVTIYDIKNKDSGRKILGHLSLLLDILLTNDGKYVITSDRDEKIKVSCYPNTHNIHSFCLGHLEFVNHIELLPHNNRYLVSTSGDGTIKFWDYQDGKLVYNINPTPDTYDPKTIGTFIKTMDEEGVEVDGFPIVLLAVAKLDENLSLLAVSMHTYSFIHVYTVSNDTKFSHQLIKTIDQSNCPTSMQFVNKSLYVYCDKTDNICVYTLSSENPISMELEKDIKVFDNVDLTTKATDYEFIKVLFKRKFDNVKEYQERKKQRILRTSQPI